MQYTCCVEGGDFFGGKQKVTVAAASAAELADFVVARCGVDSACKLMCRRDESELYTALDDSALVGCNPKFVRLRLVEIGGNMVQGSCAPSVHSDT